MLKVVDQKIIVVTRATRLRELRAKYNTRGQAKFHILRARENAVADFATADMLKEIRKDVDQSFDLLEREDQQYNELISDFRERLKFDVPVMVVDRARVPTLVFGPHDVVITVGQDGLVANVAKYALGLPIIGVNPDPARIDGILLLAKPTDVPMLAQKALAGSAKMRSVTLAEVTLNDGQRLLAFNDLFVGARSHVSARYQLRLNDKHEQHSSSGVLIATGAGSTGWLSSVFHMTQGVAKLVGAPIKQQRPPMRWEDRKLLFVVREPFVSKTSRASLVAGTIAEKEALEIESQMTGEGVIFSDGIESDYLAFNAGTIARIGVAKERALLVTP